MKKLKPKKKRRKRQKGQGPQRMEYPGTIRVQGLPSPIPGLNAAIQSAEVARAVLEVMARAGRDLNEAMTRLQPYVSAKSLIELQLENLHEDIVRDVRVIRFKKRGERTCWYGEQR